MPFHDLGVRLCNLVHKNEGAVQTVYTAHFIHSFQLLSDLEQLSTQSLTKVSKKENGRKMQ